MQQDAHETLVFLLDKLHNGFSKHVNIDITGHPKNKFERLQIESYNNFKNSYVNVLEEYSSLFIFQFAAIIFCAIILFFVLQN